MATRQLSDGRTLEIADVLYLGHRLSVELCREDADGQCRYAAFIQAWRDDATFADKELVHTASAASHRAGSDAGFEAAQKAVNRKLRKE